MKASRLIILALLIAAVACFFIFDLGEYLTLESIKARSGALHAQVQAHPWWARGVFFLGYAALTALSFPGTVVLTLLAGALFGLLEGTLLVSIASNVGAVMAMLISRFMLRDWVQKRFGKQITGINKGLARDGTFYLVSLRLIPLVPFVLLNPALGLTRVSIWTFWWTTQLGMLPGHAIYVNAGQQLVRLQSLSGILSPSMIGTLVLLAVFPIVATRMLTLYKARKAYRGWHKPKRFERNLVVIGGGTGGMATARIAASLKARVSLIERQRLGGVAVHEGSVPARALSSSAGLVHALRHDPRTAGSQSADEVDFAGVMTQVKRLVDKAVEDASPEHYAELGVEVIMGEGRLKSPWEVEVNGRTLATRAVVIATGSRPWIPPIPGLEAADPLTCDNLWNLQERPERLLILGGEAGACEFAQAFQRLGCQVTLVCKREGLLEEEDEDAARAVTAALAADGVRVRLGVSALRVEEVDGERQMVCAVDDEGEERLPFDRVLLALGQSADIEGLGTETLGLCCADDGSLEVDEYLATRFPNIYAVGSVAGPYGAPHVAEHQAWYAAFNSLFGGFKRFVVSERAIPHAVFTSPEVASVGLTEAKAQALGVEFDVTRLSLGAIAGAVAEGAEDGFVKVLTERGKDRILGVTIVGDQASETLAGFVLAMKHKLGLNKLANTVQLGATLGEASRVVATAWRQQRRPARAIGWSERLHRWRLGGQRS
ncbi:FAD-dependent oxidoreductase [Stutzerimonas stutzeri]|uniref:FAD-dependent oxidoreductase n=1 Tax=Stutzerimonas stutzeri TaxID=316 RepID=UPI001C2EBA16|nr:bifunctional TVP38/TMEM64 family protein/FAD-dependent oxidoreductase [Stutzerimonas stutzeri]